MEDSLASYRIKGAILGDWSTGKTTFFHTLTSKPDRPVDHESVDSTVGVGFFTQRLHFNTPDHGAGYTVNCYLWDTSGTERFRSIITPYLRNAAVVLIMFDVSDRTTWDHVDYWRNLALDHAELDHLDLPVVGLVGCKADQINHVVSEAEIQAKATEWGNCPWWIVSNVMSQRSLPGSLGTDFTMARYDEAENTTHMAGKSMWTPFYNLAAPLSPKAQASMVVAELVKRFHHRLLIMDQTTLPHDTCSLGHFADRVDLGLASNHDDDDQENSIRRRGKNDCCIFQ